MKNPQKVVMCSWKFPEMGAVNRNSNKKYLPCRELTYPTLGRLKIIFKSDV